MPDSQTTRVTLLNLYMDLIGDPENHPSFPLSNEDLIAAILVGLSDEVNNKADFEHNHFVSYLPGT